MSADAAVRVLIAEPNELQAEILTAALGSAGFALEVFSGAVPGLSAAAAGAHVLVLGPTTSRAGLPAMIPKLVAAGTRLLVVSEGTFDDAASALLYAGASGFVSLVDSGLDEVAQAVLAISRGSTALNPDIVHDVLERWREQRAVPPTAAVDAGAALTTREAQVLQALAEGLTNRLIARRLGVAEKTVETHKSKLFVKLGARTQAQAVRVALERGVL